MINKYCDMFKCGIGIDYGEMYVHKTGIIKQGNDSDSYKSLIWIGRPANIASRLTDVANKDVTNSIFRVRRNPLNFSPFFPPSPLILGMYSQTSPQSYYSSTEETIDMSLEEFTNSITKYSDGQIQASGGKILSFEKIETKDSNPAILITRSVYSGYVKDNFESDIIKKGLLTEKNINIRDYSGKIYGGNIYWSNIAQVTI